MQFFDAKYPSEQKTSTAFARAMYPSKLEMSFKSSTLPTRGERTHSSLFHRVKVQLCLTQGRDSVRSNERTQGRRSDRGESRAAAAL
eukprot:3332431-Prymnesium_polylepis.2